MNPIIQLAGVCGSLRKRSYNNMLLHAIRELLPEDVSLDIIHIAGLPLYNGDLDIPEVPERPEAVADFRNSLSKADGFIIVSPEYNYSIPGGLKNAIDWASRGDDSPMMKKPVALMGVTDGSWGTVRMQLAFQPVFLTLQLEQVKPEILVSEAPGRFDEEGKLVDKDTRALLIKQLIALKERINKQRGEQLKS